MGSSADGAEITIFPSSSQRDSQRVRVIEGGSLSPSGESDGEDGVDKEDGVEEDMAATRGKGLFG